MGFKPLALFWMFLIRRSEVAYTSWDMELLPRNATWHTHKENTSLLIHKKCVADFPGKCALFSQKNFIFHSLSPYASLTCACSLSAMISKLSAPSSLQLSLSIYLQTKGLHRGEGGFPCVSFFVCKGQSKVVSVRLQRIQCDCGAHWKLAVKEYDCVYFRERGRERCEREKERDRERDRKRAVSLFLISEG